MRATLRENVSKTSRQRAKSLSSQPTSVGSVRVTAPGRPPLTGASRYLISDSARNTPMCSFSVGSPVPWLTTMDPKRSTSISRCSLIRFQMSSSSRKHRLRTSTVTAKDLRLSWRRHFTLDIASKDWARRAQTCSSDMTASPTSGDQLKGELPQAFCVTGVDSVGCVPPSKVRWTPRDLRRLVAVLKVKTADALKKRRGGEQY